MPKIDIKQALKPLYHPTAKAVVAVDVPACQYMMIDGTGDPNTAPAYTQAVEALFSVSYTVKFMLKNGPQAIDYTVMPLEGLWWAEDMTTFSTANKSNWLWTLMIMQPPVVTEALIHQAIDALKRKRKAGPAVEALRLETCTEGRCAQTLHIGPFTEEGPTIARVHAFIHAQGAALTGKHHEIYLSDIRRADPAKWKTIIRQPMQ